MSLGLYLFDKGNHWGWYTSRVPTQWAEGMGGFVVADTETGEPKAAIVFNKWTASTCTIGMAVDSPVALRHSLIETACDFAFNVHNRIKVLIEVSAKNSKSLKFVKNVGFKEIFRIKDGNDIDDDLVILELTEKTCRLINKE